MTQQEEIINAIKVLRQEVEVLTSRLRPSGTGYLHTAIDVINKRISELEQEFEDQEIKDGFIPDREEDVYDGYAEHTEAMQQARLRKIQDSAAGKPNAVRDAYLHSSKVKDEVERSPCYYDTERNKAPNMQTMTSDGLSNRSMKQKHGQAVMTTSEMMQEELEPLPINTFT